jgi:hypothetical protein
MNTRRNNSSAFDARFRRWKARAAAALLAALALALMGSARAETPPAGIPFSDVGAKATAGYQGDALSVTTTADGARLRCGFQKLEAYATPDGLWLESTKPGTTDRLRVVATALGRDSSSACEWALIEPDVPELMAPTGVGGYIALADNGNVSVRDTLVRFIRAGLTEEYSVSVGGVRQDFVIAAPPGGRGTLRVELALSGARAEATPYGAKLWFESSGRALAYSRLQAEDATGRELVARLEVLSTDRLAVSVADANATYPLRIDPTVSDADWVSLNLGIPGADAVVRAMVADGAGNLYVAGDFKFIGTVPANHIAKWDGSTWSALGSGITSVAAGVYALAVTGTTLYAGGRFTTAGGAPITNLAKWDGSTWSALGSGLTGDSVSALATIGTDLYAGGYFTTGGGVLATNLARWNGTAWSPLGLGTDSWIYSLAASGTSLYVGGPFTKAGGLSAKYVAKWDGSTWSPLGSGLSAAARALAVNGTDLYAAGDFGVARWDGSTWSPLGSRMTGCYETVCALAVSGTNLYAGGSFTTIGGPAYIARWNGSAWKALDGPGLVRYNENACVEVHALALVGIDLYAGGSFTMAGAAPANYIAKWDGSAWSALGSGVNYPVLALATSETNLYAGGQFTMAGAAPANYIAKWDGSAWSALGNEAKAVHALTMRGGVLHAGGSFMLPNGPTVSAVAKLDGSAWSVLGSSMGSPAGIDALAVVGSRLYAGGSFMHKYGGPGNCIAKWENGSTWEQCGEGLSGEYYMDLYVNALAAIGTNLYVGGNFHTAGVVAASCIAKWSDNWNGSWSALGSGINGSVCALAVSGTDLYAGGGFTKAGWVPATNIAKWNGSSWSALGSGMNGLVHALVVVETNLYAGGEFTAAGGVPAMGVAKWNGSTWWPLGSGVSGGCVYAMATDGAGHLFVGGSFTVAGKTVSPYIAALNLDGQPIPPGGVIQNIRLGTGSARLDFLGLPGVIYELQRATDVWFTQSPTTLLTTNAPPDGQCCYTDSNPPSTAAFYRLRRR